MYLSFLQNPINGKMCVLYQGRYIVQAATPTSEVLFKWYCHSALNSHCLTSFVLLLITEGSSLHALCNHVSGTFDSDQREHDWYICVYIIDCRDDHLSTALTLTIFIAEWFSWSLESFMWPTARYLDSRVDCNYLADNWYRIVNKSNQ